MFTKYTNMKLPQNYSGSRFKPAVEDTEMKTHRAADSAIPVNSVKTSVSPYFQSSFSNEQAFNFEAEDNEPIETEESAEADLILEESTEVSAGNEHATLKELTRLFEGVKSDDLLLLALIILLASDGGQSSVDTIVILALLLLYR